MQRLHTPADATRIADEAMRDVILQRFSALAEVDDFTFDELAEFWLVESGDTIEVLETATNLPIGHGWFSDARFGADDFVPAWEGLEAHPTCYELLFVTNDAGYGVVLWIPKESTDPVLLAMCRCYATPAPVEPLTAI